MSDAALLAGYQPKNIPTIAESGLPGFEATSWFALYAPAGLPKDVQARINAETARVMALPDELHYYDLYAPLVSSVELRYTPEEAQRHGHLAEPAARQARQPPTPRPL